MDFSEIRKLNSQAKSVTTDFSKDFNLQMIRRSEF